MTTAAEHELDEPVAETDPPDDETVDDDEAPPAEPEPDDEPESRSEPTDEQLAALDAENRRHEAKLHEVMGAFIAGFEPCEQCAGSGLAPPNPAPVGNPNYRTCSTCRGWGQVLTGSIRSGNEVTDCPDCRGRGYVERLDSSGAPLGSTAPPPAISVAPPPAELDAGGIAEARPEQEAERWGVPSWMGDPTVKPA